MVKLDIVDNHDFGMIIEEVVVKFIRLGHEVLPLAKAGRAAPALNFGAQANQRVEPGVFQKFSNHGRRC